jgi:hypothetical protein
MLYELTEWLEITEIFTTEKSGVSRVNLKSSASSVTSVVRNFYGEDPP